MYLEPNIPSLPNHLLLRTVLTFKNPDTNISLCSIHFYFNILTEVTGIYTVFVNKFLLFQTHYA